MMYRISVLSLLLVCGTALAADNSQLMKIISIETRESGSHAIYFDGVVPTQNCDYNDRAIIVENDSVAKTTMGVALTALSTQLSVIVRVDGCVALDPAVSTVTSPKVIKLHIYR